MVALVAGLVVLTSVYAILSSSTRHFHEQQRVAQTQMGLRMGLEQLRRDISLAGFGGTPNSLSERRGMVPPRELAALSILDGDGTAALPNAAENGVTADTLRLVGNFMTGDSYLAVDLSTAGDAVTLQNERQAYRRSFGVPFDAALFEDVFREGRMLHIETTVGNHFFVTITGTNAANGVVSFTPSLAVGSTCVGSLAEGALVSPL